MAKFKRYGRKRRSPLTYLQMEHPISLGALTAGDVTAGDFSQVMDDRVYAVWAKGSWSIAGGTAGEGPVTVGFAHSDYTAAEIEECLESAASWDQGDKVAQEQRKRKVRRAGTIDLDTGSDSLNNGAEKYMRLGFIIEDGETLATWARTKGLLTTGATMSFSGIIAVRRL